MQLEVERYVGRLAKFLAKKDAYDHRIIDDGKYRDWEQVPQMGQEEYLKDAEQIVQAFILLGWGPAKYIEFQTVGALHTTIRRDPSMPAALKRTLTKWLKDVRDEIQKDHDEQQRRLDAEQ